jgi:2Fe-2S ferredoxin
MAQITWILKNGERISAEVKDGTNLMTAAVFSNVPGVVGECGGCLSCATCHVVVDDEWRDIVGAAEGSEDDMLDITEAGKMDGSRLSCQVVCRPEFDGLVVRVV